MSEIYKALRKISEKKSLEDQAHLKTPGLVSVCMPNYNKQKYIKEAILSISKQTYPHIELVIVDDKSTDESRSIIHEAITKLQLSIPVRTLFLPKRCGTAWAQNMAYYLSSGEYIANMDSDDVSDPNRIQEQVMAMKNNNYDLVGTNFSIFSEDTAKPLVENGGSWLLYDSEEIADSYMFKLTHCVCFGTLMFKSSLIDKIGGMNKKFIGTEDFEIVDRAISQGAHAGNLNQILYHYRENPSQRSRLFHGS